MHETSIVQALLASVEREAAVHGAHGVVRIEISVGPLSGVEPDLLRSAFEVMREGTVAASARLIIRTPGIVCRCRDCGRSRETDRLITICPACGSRASEVRGGDELMLDRLELEREEVPHV